MGISTRRAAGQGRPAGRTLVALPGWGRLELWGRNALASAVRLRYEKSVNRSRRWVLLLTLAGCLCRLAALGQIDPTKRSLLQFGYNAPLEGHSPLSAYAFYYYNQPGFLRTNLTLRLAVAPTYLDSELGIAHALGRHTDLGVGLAGGGFADSYSEIRHGTYYPSESFLGYGVEPSLSLYHLFNPDHEIPLYGLVRGSAGFSTYDPSEDTASNFQVPADRTTLYARAGLRWGGREPVLFPALAMELSVWYEGQFRVTGTGAYGYGDRAVESQSHIFWSEAMLGYTMPKLKHSFYLSLTAGTSLSADRFSCYRLGSLLPLVSEYPLPLPGYYYQEISATRFFLASGNYLLPLDRRQRWNLGAIASTSVVDYLPGLGQPGNWNNGVGGGLLYVSPSWKIMVGYAYGIEAIRSHGRGAHSIGVLVQLDLPRAREAMIKSEEPGRWRGFQHFLNVFGL
jgi:hypothetical protein